MNYGDPNDPPTGRAQVPGSSDSPGASSGRGPAGRASVGRASASGSASVSGRSFSGSAPYGGSDEPSGSITGRASVRPVSGGGAAGRASVRPTSGGGAAGRASVRASVPVGPGGPGGLDGADILESGPGSRGPHDAKGPKTAGARAKRRRRRNIIIAGIAAFIMLAGIGMVTGTYYFDSVALPQDITLKESTTIFYANGAPMAKIGEENRSLVTIAQIPKKVQEAVVATEDNSFYQNTGVDYKGIARAAWNNVTGGERQGASTISQQYARHWADLSGVTYARKLREAVIAMKLNKQYSKDKIMEMYLNIVYFGRGAYGIEAASEAYFGKTVDKLTTEEGMILAGMIKNPEGSKGKGSPFDPTVDKQQAQDRFNNYIKPNMLKLGFINQQEFDQMKYPETVVPAKSNDVRLKAQWGLDKPEGLIVHHVMDELSQIKKADGSLMFADAEGDIKNGIRNGGLRIMTTIDPNAQADAIKAASGTVKDTPMYGQPPNLQAALVSVEPGTGRVRAYYGGPNGAGCDFAAGYNDPVLTDGGDNGCSGAHPPASSFKTYTLATALMAGYKVDSYWNATSGQTFPGRAKPVKNAGEGNGSNGNCQSKDSKSCMLWEVTEQSLNVPFYAITNMLGVNKVLATANAAGIRSMWATVDGKAVKKDLTNYKGTDFGDEAGFGQYPVTVLDHANGQATFAARGYYNPVHFVSEVYEKDADTAKEKKVYGEKIAPKRIPGFTDGISDDLNWVLEHIPKRNNETLNGWEAAGKTGSWQLGDGSGSIAGNAHAWMVGYTMSDNSKKSPGLATAVWVGNKAEEVALKNKDKQTIIGAREPGKTWQYFMNNALKDMKMPKVKFNEPKYTGDKTEGTGTSPQPVLPSTPPDNNQPGDNTPVNPNPSTSNSGGTGGGGGTNPRPSRSSRNN